MPPIVHTREFFVIMTLLCVGMGLGGLRRGEHGAFCAWMLVALLWIGVWSGMVSFSR